MDFQKANFPLKTIEHILKTLYFPNLDNPVITPLTGIANNNYRIHSITHDLALKIYSHGQSDRSKIIKEIEAMELFRSQGIAIPHFVSGKDHRILQTYQGFNLVMTEFIDGNVLDQLAFTPDRMQAVGQLVAKVEQAATKIDISHFPYTSFRQELDDVSQTISAEIKSRQYQFNLSTYQQLKPTIDQIIQKLDTFKAKQFLHKDIWPWNIIQTSNQLYLLDFNDWAIGHPIIELSVPLLEFSMFKSDIFDQDIARNILTGYTAIKPLTYTPIELWETMMFICYLYFAYNVIQADDPFESEIYLKRLDTLIRQPQILVPII